MGDSKSCLVQKLSYYVDLTSGDEELLAKLEGRERGYDEDEVIWSEGDRVENLFVVKSGWSYSGSWLASGRRQVIQIHYPGDIIGMSQLPFLHAQHGLNASTSGVLCPFPKSHLDAIFTHSPRLTALLFTLATVEQAAFYDRLRAIARMNAHDRVCHFLLEIHARLGITGGDTSFRLPLTQAIIGDALGLTNVSVSRVMSELEREGLITRSGRRIDLPQLDHMRTLVEFHDRFSMVSTDWFPVAT